MSVKQSPETETMLEAELKRWRAEHPGRKRPRGNELIKWRKAYWEAYFIAMNKACKEEHPGEEPLPEHFCILDNPPPGFKRWAAKVCRFMEVFEARYKPQKRQQS